MTLPQTMTCIEITEPGGPEKLVPTTRPVPVAGKGEVLIRVMAAGINRPDVVQREGHYAPPPGVTDIPGLEIAGEVVALGEGVSGVAVGDKVCALIAGGGYAEYATAEVECLLPIPAGLSMVEAAALPETSFTVWSNIFDRAHLQAGESLLIHGGASGIGTTAIQFASRLGARVIVTAGGPEQAKACLELGAEKVVDYLTEDFTDPAREFGGGKGVNVILDIIGGDYIQKNIKAAAPDGRIVNIAYMKGAKVEVNFMPLMLKRLTMTGSTLRSQPLSYKGEIARSLKGKIWPLIEAGQIKPLIYKVFPLKDAAASHALMESNKHVGKIVLDVASNG